MYALVIDGTVEAVQSSLPGAARRLDTQEWVSPDGGLENGTVTEQEACGWFVVVDVAKPADTPTTTFDRSVGLVAGDPTVVWTERPKTAEELAAVTASTNQSAILTNLASDLAAMQTIINTANGSINAPAAIKDIARMLRRLGRLAVNDLTGAA